MKKVFLLAVLLTSNLVMAQHQRCMTTEAINYQESLTPGYKAQIDKAFDKAKEYAIANPKSSHLYTIPVVVHVVYNTPAQNIPDSVIIDQIRVLNEDYNRQNEDTVNMRSDFDIVKGNPRIEFMLAQIDPLGNPTTGITRTQTATTTYGTLALLGGDFSDLEKVKSTADGGIDPWDQSRYLNIWVCNMAFNVLGTEIVALLGYATPPAGLPNWPPGSTTGMSDGVVIQYQAFGTNNPNPLDVGAGPIDVRGRTSVHEVGHYLGLRHIWGDGDCTAQDGIDDTPNADAQSDNDCDSTKNTCTDNIQGVDLPDMIENFMDYSAETCQNTFTQGQIALMHGVLESERYDLVHGNPAGVEGSETITWSVFPNPTTGELIIEGIEIGSTISLIDNIGNEVFKQSITNQKTHLALNTISNGVYHLNVVTLSGQATTKKIVKY